MGFESEFRGLIRSSRGSLSDSELTEVREFIEARDYALALETLCGMLLAKNQRVPQELFFRIHSLDRQIDGVDPYFIRGVKAIVVT